MNFRKILYKVTGYKVTGVLAGLLVLVLIGLTIYQKQLIKRANQEAPMGNEAAVGTGGDVSSGKMDTDQEALKKQTIGLQKKMLEDPAVRESIQSGLEAQYKSLFEVLTLSPEQREKLKELLTNSAMAYIELNPEILAAVTDQEKELLQRRYDNLRTETQFRVEALLGHDAYKKFQAYEDRTFSRTVVSGFFESLAPGDGLTESQKKELIEIMYGEAQEVYADIGYDPTTSLTFPSDMDPETISKRMEVSDRILLKAAEGSWSILTESQFKAYNDYLRTYSEQAEMSLIMMYEQYGG